MKEMEGTFSNETNHTSSMNGGTAPLPPTFPEYLHQPLWAHVFQITLWSTVVFLGVIGNLLVCTVILRRPRMKTTMNYYLLSLAVADLGVLILIYPVAVLKYLRPFRWVLGKPACLFMVPTQEIFFGSSIWSITAIAIERYRNIIGSKRYQLNRGSRTTTWMVIMGVWLASFLVSCVPLYPVITYEPSIPLCYPDWSDNYGGYAVFVSYSVALIVVWYALPLAVIAFTYIRIKNRVRRSAVFRQSMSIGDEKEEILSVQAPKNHDRSRQRIWRQSNKARQILTPLVVLFAVTMFPLTAFRLLILIKPKVWTSPYYNLLMGQVTLFVMVNSSANPLVYYITSKEFKDALKELFKKRRSQSWRQCSDKGGKASSISRMTGV